MVVVIVFAVLIVVVNRVISASLTNGVIEYNKIEKWDGKLPQVTGSNGTMINFDDSEKAE